MILIMYRIEYLNNHHESLSDTVLCQWLKKHLGEYDNAEKIPSLQESLGIRLVHHLEFPLYVEKNNTHVIHTIMCLIRLHFKSDIDTANNLIKNGIEAVQNAPHGNLTAVLAKLIDNQIQYVRLKIKTEEKRYLMRLKQYLDIEFVSYCFDLPD